MDIRKTNAIAVALPTLLALLLTACVANQPKQERTVMVWGAAAEPAAQQGKATSPSAKTAQEPKAPPKESQGVKVLQQMTWLTGCWKAEIKGRDYHEHWLPLRNQLLLGTSYYITKGKMLNHQFLRLQVNGDDLELIVTYSDRNEQHFKYVPDSSQSSTPDASGESANTFTFVNEKDSFPGKLVYRYDSENWLMLIVSGTQEGRATETAYPIQRANCATREIEFE